LNGGAIAGIVIGALVICGAIVFLLLFFFVFKSKSRDELSINETNNY
jgi:uncharacterized membrane protein